MNQDIKEFIDQYSKLLPVGSSISFTEAERRAGEFLHAMARITDWKHTLSAKTVRILSIQTAVYSEQMSKGTAKTVTENKLTAEASPEYVEAREEVEYLQNDVSYLRAYYDIFNNAHIFYRNMAKEQNV